VALACRRWQLHRRAVEWLRGPPPPHRLVQGQVVTDDAGQLRAELDHVRAQVARLENAANRPIDVITENYERIGRQYRPAAVGKPRTQP
jgi:hypothetical protein